MSTLNKVNYPDFALTITFIKKSILFIKSHSTIYIAYYFFTLLFFSSYIWPDANIFPKIFIFPIIFIIVFGIAYDFMFPLLIWKSIHKEEIEIKWAIKTGWKYTLNLFPITMLYFFIILIPVEVLHYVFHITLSPTHTNGFGFYPNQAVFWTFFNGIETFILFTPLFYSLSKQNIFVAVINSIKTSLHNLDFILPILIFNVIHYFLFYLFVPSGNFVVHIIELHFELLTGMVFITAAYFYYDEKHTIKLVPEVLEKEEIVKVNDVYRRITAAIFDMVFAPLLVFMVIVLFDVMRNRIIETSDAAMPYIVFLIFPLGLLLYYVLFEWLWQGTPGKRIVRIRVLSENGERARFKQILIRNIFRIIDCIPYIIPYFFGLIVLSANDKKQRIGDKIGHTIVVK